MDTAKSVLTAWRKGLARRLPAALDRACRDLARKVEANAPKDTGELAGAVEVAPVKVTPSRISSAVVVASDHALAREYGTAEQLPDPFFRPAIASELPGMIATVKKAAGL